MNAHHSPQPHETEPMPSHLDAWHQHTVGEGTPREEHAAHANVSVLLVTFVVITIGTLAFSVFIGIYAIGQTNRLKTAGEQVGLEQVSAVAAGYKRDALDAQQEYSWTPEGRVRLPIDQAMRLVAESHQERSGQ